MKAKSVRKILCLFVLLLVAGPQNAQDFPQSAYKSLSLFDRDKMLDIFSLGDPDGSGADKLFQEKIDNKNPFSYSQTRFNDARQAVESGILDSSVTAPRTQEIFDPLMNAQNLPPSLQLTRYGTSLSVTGRKLIGMEYSGKRYLNDQTNTGRDRNSGSFDLNQEMQIRIQGKIGPRISVNVDYDDTKIEKQDISIIYQGEDDEIVQNASFGDIDLSLPPTEFVSYNKQLFGIRMDLQFAGFKGTLIGSRTKGTNKVKQFVGNTLQQSKTILDTGYVRRKYYSLKFTNQGRLPIVQASEQVYIDTQSYTEAAYNNTVELTVADYTMPSSQYTGRFRLLSRGIDYVIDYTNGTITFSTPLNQQDVVAVNFTNSNGTKLSANPVLLKTYNDLQIASPSEYGYQAELKTYYSIGQTQIVRDDGKGNFTLIVQDANKNNVGASLSPQQTYSDTITVDFENGIFYLKEPFGSASDPSTPDPQIYAPTPTSKRTFLVEYNSRIKTFTLEPDIVVQSENVVVDGRKLTRNVDYYVDYDSGFITFYNDELIKSTSVLDVSYDISPYGGMGTAALLGTRLGYDFGKKVSVGTTILYEAASKPQTTPGVSETASSTIVYEGDLKFKDIEIGKSSVISFSVEGAHSTTNPNLNGYALIDNMEGVKEQTTPTLSALYWQIASTPSMVPAYYTAVNWRTEEHKVLDIFPQAQVESGTKQDVLAIDYDFTNSDEIAIVYPYSASGLDFSKKNMLEMQIFGDAQSGTDGPQLQIHLGQIDEDSDASGGETRVCSNGVILTNAPKSEDLNCNGLLDSNEDIGWLYAPAGQPSTRYGSRNGRIDTQDLDGNGRLDSANNTGGSFGYNGTMTADFNNVTDAQYTDRINFSGWKALQAPIEIPSGQEYMWSAVKHLRVALKKVPGGKTKGTIRIARLSVVGNSWSVVEQGQNSSVLNLGGINNEDNPGYIPIFSAGGDPSKVYNYLYGSPQDYAQRQGTKNVIEQSLNLMYSSMGPARLSAQRNFTTALNISKHNEVRFLLANPLGNEVTDDVDFYLRIGDDANYQQVNVPLNFTGWRLFSLKQIDVNGDGVPDYWENNSSYDITVSSQGYVNFQSVSILSAGVEVKNGAHSGAIWFNELHVANPNDESGSAISAKFDYKLKGWGEVGGQYRSVDKDFQTPVTVSTNQDQELIQGYMNISKIKFAPIATSYTRTRTETPASIDSTNSNLVSSLDEGVVIKEVGKAETTLLFDRLPALRLAYDFAKNDYQLLTRKDDNKSYTVGLTYNTQQGAFYVPRKLNANYTLSKNETGYSQQVTNSNSAYYNAKETVTDLSLNMEFAPLKDSVFAPSYSLKTVKESRDIGAMDYEYDKSMAQTAGLSGNIKFLEWLNPTYNYQITTIENNNLSLSTVTVGNTVKHFNIGQIKTVNRTATGLVNLSLEAAKIFPKVKWLSTLAINGSYQLADGDTWENVDSSYDTKAKLWIRTPLNDSGSFASRTNMTSRDTYRATMRWRPFYTYSLNRFLAALQTMSISNTFSHSKEFKDITGTTSTIITRTLPDLLVTMTKLESFFGSPKWISGGSLNFKYSYQTVETRAISDKKTHSVSGDIRFLLFQVLDSAITASMLDSQTYDIAAQAMGETNNVKTLALQFTFMTGNFRISPKLDYSRSTTEKNSILTEDTTAITPSISLRGDFTLAKGLKLPFVKNPLSLTNRIVWITTLSYRRERSDVEETKNSNLGELSTSIDYELSQNVRLTATAGVQRLWHMYLDQEEYMGYNAGASLVLQF